MNTKLILAASAVLLTTGAVASLSIAQQAQADSGKERGVTEERARHLAQRVAAEHDHQYSAEDQAPGALHHLPEEVARACGSACR